MQELASDSNNCPSISNPPKSIYKLAEALIDDLRIILADELLFKRFFNTAGDMLVSNRHSKLEPSEGTPQLVRPSTIGNLLKEARQQMVFIAARWLGNYEINRLYPNVTPAILPEPISTKPKLKPLPESTSVKDIKAHLGIDSILWKKLIVSAIKN